MNPETINLGLAYLDEVKHCQDRMTPEMVEADRRMRDTPPAEWTEADVMRSIAIARHVNPRVFRSPATDQPNSMGWTPLESLLRDRR